LPPNVNYFEAPNPKKTPIPSPHTPSEGAKLPFCWPKTSLERRKSPFVSKQSPFVSKQSSFVSKQSSFVSKQSSFVSKQSSFVSKQSSFVSKQSSFVSKQSSFVRAKTPSERAKNIGPAKRPPPRPPPRALEKDLAQRERTAVKAWEMKMGWPSWKQLHVCARNIQYHGILSVIING
jgi:hypothetical protein